MAGLMLCLPPHALFAQAPSVSGIVTDDIGSPVEFANVTLLSLPDSTLIDGVVTDLSGSFSLTTPISPSLLRVSAMGFEEVTIPDPHGEVGKISLSSVSLRLGEVVVKGSLPLTKLVSDGLQVAVNGSYLATTGTALDVLGKMPFVSRSGSEIEVLGKGTPIIYINGRQVRDRSELDQLSSSDIKSVDVVTSPGARYDSSVNAVIRIKTVAPVGDGFSFSDRTTAGYKHYAYIFEQLNFNYRKNGFDLFGMLNYENYRDRQRYDNLTTQYLSSATVMQRSVGRDFTIYPLYEGKIGLNYNSAVHNMGFFYDFTYKPSDGNSSALTTRLENLLLADVISYDGSYNSHNRQHLLSAYYVGTLGKWQLTANLDAMWQINDRATDESEFSQFNPTRFFTTDSDVANRLIAGNVTATFPAWKGDVRFGTEITDIFRKDLYKADVDFIDDNDTKIMETTSALFAEASQTFGKLSVTAGLRWEYTDTRYFLWGAMSHDQSRKYHNLAPGASVSLPIGKVTNSISYTRKTTRPSFGQLSSAVRYIDRYSYESGNPALRPIYRDYISLSSSWRDLVVELSYCSTDNYFMWQTTPFPGYPDATLLKMENMPRFNSFEAFANYSPCFFSIWRPTFMAGIMVQDFKLMHHGECLTLNNPLGIFRFDNAIHLPRDMWLNVDFSARTAGNTENIYVQSRWSCNLGLYKAFAHDTWSIKLQLDDLFNIYRQRMTFYDALTLSSVNKFIDTRDLSITLRYNFNPARSRYKGRSASSPAASRL